MQLPVIDLNAPSFYVLVVYGSRTVHTVLYQPFLGRERGGIDERVS